jgi:hypothetical protein
MQAKDIGGFLKKRRVLDPWRNVIGCVEGEGAIGPDGNLQPQACIHSPDGRAISILQGLRLIKHHREIFYIPGNADQILSMSRVGEGIQKHKMCVESIHWTEDF